MKAEVKLVFIMLVLTIVAAEPALRVDLTFIRKTLFNILFPKDPNIVRVRNLEEINTVNGVATLDFIGLVERHGYPAEEHYVTTEDGYNLIIHRIPGSPLSKNQEKRKKVMFLQNGMLATSDCWVLIGPGKDLAFLLADEGYDVWLGNYRGNSYCRSHVKLSTRDKEFWKFSYHEIGTRDLPAMIDYVLNYTKQTTVRYIGLSMGTTSLFTLLSMKPEYNAKIKLGILLAPVATWKERAPLMEFFRGLVPEIKEYLNYNGIYEVVSLSSTSITAGRALCADNTITQSICIAIVFLICGSDPAQLNTTMIPEMLYHFPCGTSFQALDHYFQNLDTKKFQAYDYGYLGNFKEYGQLTPIIYDLKKITAPIALYYGANDLLALKANVIDTYKQLPNGVVLEEVPFKLFNHIDFIVAIDVKTLVYDSVIELLQKYDNEG